MGKKFHYAYLIVASCIVIMCLPCALALSCAGIFFTPVSEYFGVPRAEFTLYFSILNIFMMISLPIAGNHLSRMDARKVLSGGTIMAGAGLIGMSFGQSVPWFYAMGALMGFGLDRDKKWHVRLLIPCAAFFIYCNSSVPRDIFVIISNIRVQQPVRFCE